MSPPDPARAELILQRMLQDLELIRDRHPPCGPVAARLAEAVDELKEHLQLIDESTAGVTPTWSEVRPLVWKFIEKAFDVLLDVMRGGL